MHIVIMDGAVLNPGDLSWKAFETFGSVDIYAYTEVEDVVERAKNADIILTNKVAFTEEVIAKLPKLKYIGVTATGYDVVDIAAAAKRNIPVCNVVAYGVDTVAQHVIALLLELTRNTVEHSNSVKAGEWTLRNEWCYWINPIRDLSEMRLGIMGFGNIGRKVGEIAHALGMEVQAYNRSTVPAPTYPCSFVDKDTLFATSDVISLHCPLNDDSRGFINAERIASMKQGSIIINTARGPLLDEAAVAAALHSGHLAAFGADVLAKEPPSKDNPLLSAPNCLLTPHMGWATSKARANIIRLAVENVAQWIKGTPTHVVNM